MITELPKYKLCKLSEFAFYTEITELYSILYYKRWRLLAGLEGSMLLEFDILNKFVIRDELASLEGGWKVIKKKYVILTLNNEIAYCCIAYYDGVVLILKVYGELRYLVLVSDSVELARNQILSCHVEEYVRGEKESLLKVDSLDKGGLKDDEVNLMDAKTWNARNRKPTAIDYVNMYLLWFTVGLTAACTFIMGFPWYAVLLFVAVLSLALYKLVKGVKTKKFLVTLFFLALLYFIIYLSFTVMG